MLFITWKCFSEGFRLDNKTDCSMNLALPLAVINYMSCTYLKRGDLS